MTDGTPYAPFIPAETLDAKCLSCMFFALLEDVMIDHCQDAGTLASYTLCPFHISKDSEHQVSFMMFDIIIRRCVLQSSNQVLLLIHQNQEAGMLAANKLLAVDQLWSGYALA